MEIGCGQGALALLLASHFDYRGYEPDTASWEVAQARLARRGLREVVTALCLTAPIVPSTSWERSRFSNISLTIGRR
jgi:cyclopropane fatty-acyl-phospholipid synthase-like methyltransferase